MVKNRLVISSLLLVTSAFASGCMWYLKHELGAKVGDNHVRGKFECACSEWFGTQNCQCQFIPEDHSAHFTNDLTLTEDISGNTIAAIKTESFEAMEWKDCDGGDPVPDFIKNGIYEGFTYKGFKFERFFHE